MGDAVKAVGRLGNVAARILDELEKVRARLIGTTAALKKATKALRLVEWRFGAVGYCPVCGHTKDMGHSAHCEIGDALKEPD